MQDEQVRSVDAVGADDCSWPALHIEGVEQGPFPIFDLNVPDTHYEHTRSLEIVGDTSSV